SLTPVIGSADTIRWPDPILTAAKSSPGFGGVTKRFEGLPVIFRTVFSSILMGIFPEFNLTKGCPVFTAPEPYLLSCAVSRMSVRPRRLSETRLGLIVSGILSPYLLTQADAMPISWVGTMSWKMLWATWRTSDSEAPVFSMNLLQWAG